MIEDSEPRWELGQVEVETYGGRDCWFRRDQLVIYRVGTPYPTRHRVIEDSRIVWKPADSRGDWQSY
jgi:hypothetical protein